MQARAAATRAAMTVESTAVCDRRTAEDAGRRPRGAQRPGLATARPRGRPGSRRAAMRSSGSSPGSGGGVDACGPGSPGSRPGGLGPHFTSSGFPRRAFLRLPVCPPGSPLRPPSPGSPSSGVLRFVPFGRCPVPVFLRFPSGFPFPWAISTLAPPRSGSAGVGPLRQGPRSSDRSARRVPGAAAFTAKTPENLSVMRPSASAPP